MIWCPKDVNIDSCFFSIFRACEFNGVEFTENIFDFKRPGIGHVYLYLALEGLFLITFAILAEVRQLVLTFICIYDVCTVVTCRNTRVMDDYFTCVTVFFVSTVICEISFV